MPEPARHKPYPPDARLIDLVPLAGMSVGMAPLIDVLNRRRSRRHYTDEPLSLEELSFLLWATQGVQRQASRGKTLRPVPSACASHPFETYLSVHRVTGLEVGLYRYIPLEHKLCLLYLDPGIAAKLTGHCGADPFVAGSAVTFIWTAIPHRGEWFGGLNAYKWIPIDAGHVCQNLYLASTAIGAGTCAIGGCYQDQIDALLGVDGFDELCVYLASVGKVKPGRQDEYRGRIEKVLTGGETTRLWMQLTYPLAWACVVEFPSGDASGYVEGEEVVITFESPVLHTEYEDTYLYKGIEIRRPD